jgi:hypothetical protein
MTCNRCSRDVPALVLLTQKIAAPPPSYEAARGLRRSAEIVHWCPACVVATATRTEATDDDAHRAADQALRHSLEKLDLVEQIVGLRSQLRAAIDRRSP